MKKIITLVLALCMVFACTVVLASCEKNKETYVAKPIAGIELEEYGYCINKTASKHDLLLNTINQVIADADMSAIVSYYTALSQDQEPTVTLSMPDLSDNTGDTLDVYTCSGFEPYEFIAEDGITVTGVDVYMMQLVAEALNMKLVVHDMDFDGIVASVAGFDNAVGAAGITINDDRKQSVDFSNAYYSSVQYIISKDSEAYTSLEQLAGKKIGVQKGTTGCDLVTKSIEDGVLKDTGATTVEYDTGAVAFTALKAGKIDFVVIDELPAQKLVFAQ